MSINLMSQIQDQLGGGLMRQISGILGENENVTSGAVSQAIPALLGGVMKQASTDQGAQALASTLDSFDDGLLENLGGLLSGGNHKGMLDMGSGILSNLFGGGMGSVVDAVSKSGGLGSTSTRSLLGLLAPIAMGVLSRQKKTQGLDAGGLASLVMEQKGHLTGLLPSGIANVLGIGNLLGDAATGAGGDAAEHTARAVTDTVGSAARTAEAVGSRGSSMVSRLIPLLIILILGYFGYKKFLAGDGSVDLNAPNIEAPDVSGVIDEAKDAANTMVGDIAGDMQGALNGGADALRNITDAESAQAAVPELQKMSGALDGIANKLDGLPEPVREQVTKMAGDFAPEFKRLASAAMKMPGARPILEAHVKPLMATLEGMGS